MYAPHKRSSLQGDQKHGTLSWEVCYICKQSRDLRKEAERGNSLVKGWGGKPMHNVTVVSSNLLTMVDPPKVSCLLHILLVKDVCHPL